MKGYYIQLIDAVVQIEDTICLEKNSLGKDAIIEVVGTTVGCGGQQSNQINISIGQDIRPIGFDIKIGEVVVRKRSILRAAQIGMCATVGALAVKVFGLPTVSLISTGNELSKPDVLKLNEGQIRDSNKSLLHAALKSFGIEHIRDAGVATDEPDSVCEVFRRAIDQSDVIISTGGVSMGDKASS